MAYPQPISEDVLVRGPFDSLMNPLPVNRTAPAPAGMEHQPAQPPWTGPLIPNTAAPSLGVRGALAAAAPVVASSSAETRNAALAPPGAIARGGEDASVAAPYGAPTAPTGKAPGGGGYPTSPVGFGGDATPGKTIQSFYAPPEPGAVPDSVRNNAYWEQANRVFDANKRANDLTNVAQGEYAMQLGNWQAQTQSAKADLANAQRVLEAASGGGVADSGRIAALKANVDRLTKLSEAPMPTVSGAIDAFTKTQTAAQTAAETANRTALTGAEVEQRRAQAGLERAQAGEVTEKTKGYALDRAGKLLDNQGKEIDLKLLGQKFEAGKTSQQQQDVVTSLMQQMDAAKGDPAKQAQIAYALTVAHGKDPEQWKFQKLEKQEPIDPTQPALGVRRADEAFLYNPYTKEVLPIGGPPPAMPPYKGMTRRDRATGKTETFDGTKWTS